LKKEIGVISLGCPKNLVDSEIMLGLLKKKDYVITNNQENADIIIINTCGFIESAKQESINTILEMVKFKERKCQLIIVTGCLAERYKEQIMNEIPEIDAVIGTGNYSEIAEVIEKAYNGEKTVLYGKLKGTEYLENDRVISTDSGFAYLKIAEGCDNCCTYCVIPSLRGGFRSRKVEDIVKEAVFLADSGVKELIIVAQDTTGYGTDIYNGKKLVDLIRELSKINKIEWIRILYCYPEEINEELINEIAINKKVCKYIDIPIQHISDKILKLMGRRGKGSEISSLLNKLRERVPGIIIRTSIIVGFPGEDENDFDEILSFIKENKFDRLGVFTYSREEGTPASKLKQQVNKSTKTKRHNKIMEIQNKICHIKNSERLNKIYNTIVEGVSEDGIFYFGRTYAETPDIDGLIYFTGKTQLEKGEFVNVKILNIDEYDLIGEVTDEFTE
jgi:ribosomal protein S12 methylthiotransferase